MTKWTNTPPSEPGWYWWRTRDEYGVVGPFCACVFLHLEQELWAQCMEDRGGPIDEHYGEWWPERILEPEE